ncbi:hypothetical protein HDU96_001934 [Phlyctochytrium bullatum]|nr:hypothetical protein HDU96_001934 [Phlyctochytrium bullatum]
MCLHPPPLRPGRPLNPKEANYLHPPGEFTNFSLVLGIDLSPFGSLASFLASLKQVLAHDLAALHPVLRSRVVAIGTGERKQLWFEETSEDAKGERGIPLRVDVGGRLDKTVEDEVNDPFNLGEEPPVRVVVVAAPSAVSGVGAGTIHTVFTFSHCAIDGVGAIEVAKDCLCLLIRGTSPASSSPERTFSSGTLSSLIPVSNRTWRAFLVFVRHIAGILAWIAWAQPHILKKRKHAQGKERSSRTRVARFALSPSQTAAVVARAKEAKTSVTGLMMSAAALAVAPFTAPVSSSRGWTWWLLFPLRWLWTSPKSTAPKRTTRLSKPRTVPLLGGLAVNGRNALAVPPTTNGSFNTSLLVSHRAVPVLPRGTSPLGLFHACALAAGEAGAQIRAGVKPGGPAWRYAELLDRHPVDSRALQGPAVPPPQPPKDGAKPAIPLAYTLSNLGVVELGAEREWVTEAWLVSTVRPSRGDAVEVNAITCGKSLRVMVGWVEGVLDGEVAEEFAGRLGAALTGGTVVVST